MQVMFDSLTGKVTQVGQHDGNPRIWTVVLRPTFEDGTTEKWTFKSPSKVYIRDLADLIDDHLRAEVIKRIQIVTRMRWVAMAR